MNNLKKINRDHFLAKLKTHTVKNPCQSFQLEARFEISGPEVRILVQELRRKGHPIANVTPDGVKGYFYAQSYTEIEPTIRDLESRSLSMLNTIKQLKEKFYPGQKDQSNMFNTSLVDDECILGT